MVYVFFDVDGVLNREADWRNRYTLHASCVEVFGELCRKLNGLYGEVRAVIISTWRAGLTISGNCAGASSGLEKSLEREGVRIHGATPVSGKGRQAEVEYYIRRNRVGRYVVIDDDPSLFEEKERLCLFVPDYRTGLVKGDIKKILGLIK